MEERSIIMEKASKVKLVVMGVDGVLTDAGMYFNEQGDLLRKFNRRDGMGIQLLPNLGIKTAIVSSMKIPIAEEWANMFGVDFIKLGETNKYHTIEKLQIRLGITLDEIAYISDDVDEYDILSAIGFSVTVADGMSMNKKQSVYVTKRKGGEGAVREVIELIGSSKGY